MSAAADPYAVLGVARDADAAALHTAYRKAVRRTHPDAGGTAAEFEAVQDAYETLRSPGRRAAHDARAAAPRPRPPRPAPEEPEFDRRPMEDLLADSQRLENEARRLAGLPPRDFGGPEPETSDSLAAILDDAQRQLRDVAQATARELRRRVRRML
jgi:curved DNA-binding protein CbpA